MPHTLSLLGGASLGAALMYLLDPEAGSRRRDAIAESGKQAVSSTGDALGATFSTTASGASDTARSLAGRISQYAHSLADDLSSRASNAFSFGADHAKSAVDSAQSSARSASDSVVDTLADTRKRLTDQANSLLSRGRKIANAATEESHPYATATGITAGSIGVLAVGAGLMYFFDPERGAGRRNWAVEKVSSVTRRTGRRARGYGTHLGNRLKGYAHDAEKAIPENWMPGSSQEHQAGTESPAAVSSPGIGA